MSTYKLCGSGSDGVEHIKQRKKPFKNIKIHIRWRKEKLNHINIDNFKEIMFTTHHKFHIFSPLPSSIPLLLLLILLLASYNFIIIISIITWRLYLCTCEWISLFNNFNFILCWHKDMVVKIKNTKIY